MDQVNEESFVSQQKLPLFKLLFLSKGLKGIEDET